MAVRRDAIVSEPGGRRGSEPISVVLGDWIMLSAYSTFSSNRDGVKMSTELPYAWAATSDVLRARRIIVASWSTLPC